METPELPWRWELLEEHLSEAEFLWGQWEAALRAPEYTPREVAEGLESRLEAHLDGLVLGGAPVAERLLHPVLADEDAEPTRVSAAVHVLLARDMASLEALRPLLEEGTPARRMAVRRALELCEQQGLEARLLPWLVAPAEPVQAAALEVLSFRGQAVQEGVLAELLASQEPSVVAAALRAASLSPGSLGREALERALVSPVAQVREAALEAGAILGRRAAWRACQRMAAAGEASSVALLLLGLSGSEAEVELLKERLRVPAWRPAALWALGFSGRLSAADTCIELLDDEDTPVARLAAEAFCAITGLELAGEYVRADEEDEQELPLEEELERDLHPKPEDELKRAERSAVARWWTQARRRLEPQARYLRGQPWSTQRLVETLRHGPMRRRPALALELAIRTRGQHSLQVRTWMRQQFRQLAVLQGPQSPMGSQPFEQLLRLE